MRIHNETQWNTDHLRRIFRACLAEVRRYEGDGVDGQLKPSRFRVTVKTHHVQRRIWIGGCAAHNGSWATIKIPLPNRCMNQPRLAREVADTFIHELGHCLGYNHVSHADSWYDTIEHSYQQWLDQTVTSEAFPLGIAQPSARPRKDVRQERYQRALRQLQRWLTRQKRALTAIKKYKQRVRYYERAFATKPPEKKA